MDGRDPSYLYRPRWSSIFLTTVVLLPASLICFTSVIGIPIALLILGLIGLTWHQRFTGTKRLEFRSLGLFVPPWLWLRPGEIAYDRINRVSIVTGSYGNRIRIDHDGGQCELWASNLPSDAAFQEVYKLLAAKI
jgi:hypothetical protein